MAACPRSCHPCTPHPSLSSLLILSAQLIRHVQVTVVTYSLFPASSLFFIPRLIILGCLPQIKTKKGVLKSVDRNGAGAERGGGPGGVAGEHGDAGVRVADALLPARRGVGHQDAHQGEHARQGGPHHRRLLHHRRVTSVHQIAYEYARRNANLLVARREHRLFAVRDNARALGAGQVLVIAADVLKEDDCRRLVGDTISYFGQLDHLVNTVSLGHDFFFEEAGDTAAFPHLMDNNFWGNVYPTHAALPYLRRNHGRVVVNASVESWLPMPRMSLYSAAKAAVIDFYETLRDEVKDDVGVTVTTHGWLGGEAGTVGGGKFMLEEGAEMHWKGQEREMPLPGGQVEAYARTVVNGACRRDARVRGHNWYDVFLVFRAFVPDVMAWTFRLLLSTAATTAPATSGGRRAIGAPAGAPPAALPAPPIRPLIEYPAAAAARRSAGAAQLQKLE